MSHPGRSHPGILALWLDVDPAIEARCDEWYVREHIPDRIRLPGFRSARRFDAVDGAPRYLAVYEADTLERMLEPGYMGLVHRISDESRAIRGGFRNVVRATLRITARAGFGEGAAVAAIRFAPAPDRAEDLRAWLSGTLLPAMVARHCLVAAQLWEGDAGVRARMDAVRATGSTDALAEWVLLLEGTRPRDVVAACDALLPPGTLQHHGAGPAEQRGVYTLMYAVHAPEAPSR